LLVPARAAVAIVLRDYAMQAVTIDDTNWTEATEH
jgi:hypothetical protein